MARDTSPGAKRKKESGAPSIFGLVNDPNALSIRLHTSGTGVEIEMTQCHPAHQREQHSARSGQRPRRRTPLSVSWCCLAFATLENSNALSIRVHLPGGVGIEAPALLRSPCDQHERRSGVQRGQRQCSVGSHQRGWHRCHRHGRRRRSQHQSAKQIRQRLSLPAATQPQPISAGAAISSFRPHFSISRENFFARSALPGSGLVVGNPADTQAQAYPSFAGLCSREESNLHGLPHTVLSRTRLPFRHVSAALSGL